jgi:uncharacterized protein YbcI
MELTTAISDSVSDLYWRYYGQVPAQITTYITGEFIFCVLASPFTTAERSLLETGDYEAVRLARQAFDDAMGARFIKVVSDIVGAEVIAHMAQTCAYPELAVEIFKLKDSYVSLDDLFELS